jgi:uncharacterized protein YhaN
MRIRKLGLRRYGKFTDAVVDFGQPKSGGPDLHIVYGPNEAGKSTAMSACLDLIYGIQPHSRFNFLHPYPAMRIEAEVENSSGIRILARIKRPQNSLLDDADRPIADASLLGEIGGLDRSAYQTMFCLDDETLEAGGESILASKGDLGHLLFSATAGLANLSHQLGSAYAEADAFFRSGKRTGILADLKKELAVLKETRDGIDTLASEFSRLVVDRDDTTKAYEEALAQRGRTQARSDEIQRVLNVLPRLHSLRGLRTQLAPLATLPDAPPTWAADLPDLMTKQTKLATQTQTVADALEDLTRELEGLAVNYSVYGLKSRAELLTDVRARYVTAEKDLPDRRLQLSLAEQTVARILSRIDRATEADPTRLVLSTTVTGELRKLIERRSGVEAALAGAEAELEKARNALTEAEERLGTDDGGLDATTSRSLAAAMGVARQSDDSARFRAADRIRQERADEMTDCLIELSPWKGGGDALLSIPVPAPDQLEHWASADTELAGDLGRRHGEVDRLSAEAAQLDGKIEALGSAAGVVSDQEAGAARSAREAAWAAHKNALDATTAAAFETEMRKFDLVTEQRFGHIEGVAELNRALMVRGEVRNALEQTRQTLQETVRRRAAIAEEIRRSVVEIGGGLDETMGLAGLKPWLRKRDRAIEVRGKLASAERELRQAHADASHSRERMADALRSAGVPLPQHNDVPAMLAAGQAALDHAVDAAALRTSVDDRRRELKSRERKLLDARLNDEKWSSEWRHACGTCWLGEKDVPPATAMVRETLEAIADLGSVLEKKAGLTDRVAKMERDQAQFRAEVEALAALIGLPSRPSDVIGLCQAVLESVADAARTRDRRQEIEARRLTEQEKARRLADDSATVQALAQQMTDLCNVGTLAEVDGCLRAIASRSDIASRLNAVREEILAAMQLETIEEAENVLDALDQGSLEAELIERKARYEDQDSRTRDLFAAKNKAEDRISAVGGDGSVAAIDAKRRTTLLIIEDKAVAYLKLRLGAAAADNALRAYRDRHRSSMMARASESFALISRGAYSKLVTQSSGGSEILIANGADGSSKIASELSKGTRFQLYLALRVAGYHEFVRAHAPPPFLADDIMETFDDFRAEEAFRLLAGMAGAGQVVYFTHHRHLCEIAKSVERTVTIHNLEKDSALPDVTRSAA